MSAVAMARAIPQFICGGSLPVVEENVISQPAMNDVKEMLLDRTENMHVHRPTNVHTNIQKDRQTFL